MSQPANDDFSQHLSDDEASYHKDASENGTATNKPKQQQQQLIPTTTTISNIKLPILKKEEYDIWAHALKVETKDVHLYITNMFKLFPTQHILQSLDCHALLDCLVAAVDCLLPALLHPELTATHTSASLIS
ncbi:hypothetical protein Tco_0396415 [Tanacetum coccineum]